MFAFDSHLRAWLVFANDKHTQTRRNTIDLKRYFILIEFRINFLQFVFFLRVAIRWFWELLIIYANNIHLCDLLI